MVVQGRFIQRAAASEIPSRLLPVSGGQPLRQDLREAAERHFRVSFDRVRIFPSSPQTSQLGALALTRGNDVHFAPGRFQPESPDGVHLLFHELTHVVQQSTGRARSPLPPGRDLILTDQRLELEADHHGRLGAMQWSQARAAAAVQAKLAPPAGIVQRAAVVQPAVGKNKKVATKKAARKQSKAGLHRGYRGVTEPSGTTFTGRWTPMVNVRGSRSYKNARSEQVLRQVSVQLFHYMRQKLGRNAEQEVQSMYVNDRIVVSANEDESLSAFYADIKAKAKVYAAAMEDDGIVNKPVNPLKKILATPQFNDLRTISHAEKLSGLFEGTRLFDPDFEDEGPAVNTLQSIVDTDMFVSKMDMGSAADCKKKLTDPKYLNRIIVLQNGGALHAEQKLLIALWLAGGPGSAVIYGKKRPCTGCAAALTFAKEMLKMHITFNSRPGGYWSTANPGLMYLAEQGQKTRGLTNEAIEMWVANFRKNLVSHQTHSIGSGASRHKLTGFTRKFRGTIEHDTDYGSDSDSESDD